MNAAERGAGFFRSLTERLPQWVRRIVITHPKSNLPWVRIGLHPRLSSLAHGRLLSPALEFQAGRCKALSDKVATVFFCLFFFFFQPILMGLIFQVLC